MVVSRDYMLKKTTGPSAPVHFINTRVTPHVVNMVGSAELLIERASRSTGVRPSLLLAGATGAASLLLFNRFRRRYT